MMILIFSELLDGYERLCNACQHLSPVMIELENEHLSQFSLTWEVLNKYLHQSIIYSDPIIQNNVPIFISQVRYTFHQFFCTLEKKTYFKFLFIFIPFFSFDPYTKTRKTKESIPNQSVDFLISMWKCRTLCHSGKTVRKCQRNITSNKSN